MGGEPEFDHAKFTAKTLVVVVFTSNPSPGGMEATGSLLLTDQPASPKMRESKGENS